jgi:hypothetical protein
MPRNGRCRPTAGAAPTTGQVDTTVSSLYLRQDGYAAPDAEERAVQRTIGVLPENGYSIAMRCLDCQHPITSAASLARMRGPKCAAKAVSGDV